MGKHKLAAQQERVIAKQKDETQRLKDRLTRRFTEHENLLSEQQHGEVKPRSRKQTAMDTESNVSP